MTEPLPPLISLTTDIARQSTQQDGVAAVLRAIAAQAAKIDSLTDKVSILMTEDAAVAAAAQAEEADIKATLAAVRSLQGLVTSLQAEAAAGHLSAATMDALTQAQHDLAVLRGEAAADVVADAPPSGA